MWSKRMRSTRRSDTRGKRLILKILPVNLLRFAEKREEAHL